MRLLSCSIRLITVTRMLLKINKLYTIIHIYRFHLTASATGRLHCHPLFSKLNTITTNNAYIQIPFHSQCDSPVKLSSSVLYVPNCDSNQTYKSDLRSLILPLALLWPLMGVIFQHNTTTEMNLIQAHTGWKTLYTE